MTNKTIFKKDYLNYLLDFKNECEAIESKWNGENKGILEDNAHIVHEINEKIVEIIVLLSELK